MYGPGGLDCMRREIFDNHQDAYVAHTNVCRPEVQSPVVYDDQILTLIKPAGVGGSSF